MEFIYFVKNLSGTFVCFSLLVMSVARFLTAHRTSVTKGKVLILFAFFSFVRITVIAISINDLVIPYIPGRLIFSLIFILPILCINYKLLKVARKVVETTKHQPR